MSTPLLLSPDSSLKQSQRLSPPSPLFRPHLSSSSSPSTPLSTPSAPRYIVAEAASSCAGGASSECWLFSAAAAAMDDDNWDLSAVVRSCRPSGAAAARETSWLFPPPSGPLRAVEGGKGGAFMRLTDVFEGRSGVMEMGELGGSSFSKAQLLRKREGSASAWSPRPASAAATAVAHQTPTRRKADRAASQTPRSRRRKSQQKKVVRHVAANGLSSDTWAWRKYGQKPIKGSPYPRGYYRCSSSKGCPARKQVERSRTDPGTFIVTYTSEHNHPMPTHRNSLAGSTRHKFTSTAAASCSDGGDHPLTLNPEASPLSSNTAPQLSPTTPLSTSVLSRSMKGEDGEEVVDEEEEMEEDEEDDEEELLVEDMEMMGEDDLLFVSSEEGGAASETPAEMTAFFDGNGGFEDQLFPPPWLTSSSNNAATAAAAESFSSS
ncbi:WRKY transcription factor 22-like isoform X2 [Canna indica]|uniref:WRKY transcription factor 22-like isoform X2 n=1 Tax=Canna indica TaxID=4628 RepID=A0AAQ3K505_9LILI|nr:WRKY transcription factor 22-like isoform X2 [Canna indica]